MIKTNYFRFALQTGAYVLLGMIFSSAAPENNPKLKIIESEARTLAIEGLKVYIQRNKVDDILLTRIQDKYDPDFYYFDANWINPISSPHLAYLAVNPWTGDVWNAAICKRLKSPSLHKMQQAIRKRFRLNKATGEMLISKEPLCNNR
jgi:hypothetical protein